VLVHMWVWLHCVVTGKFHPVFPKYLTVRKLHNVIVIAPFGKTTCITLEKLEHVSIFDLLKVILLVSVCVSVCIF
jgi:hypothetical protein